MMVDPSCRREAGFTLIELLVALTLSGLILAVLAAGLRFVSGAWERGEELASRHEQIGLVHQLLRREFASAQWLTSGSDQDRELLFHGGATEVIFISPADSGPLRAGLYAVRLDLRPQIGGGQQLVRGQALFDPDVRRLETLDFSDEVVLLENIDGDGFSFRGHDARDTWQKSWQNQERMPALVRLDAKILAGSENASPLPLFRARLAGQLPNSCLHDREQVGCPELAETMAVPGESEPGAGADGAPGGGQTPGQTRSLSSPPDQPRQ